MVDVGDVVIDGMIVAVRAATEGILTWITEVADEEKGGIGLIGLNGCSLNTWSCTSFS